VVRNSSDDCGIVKAEPREEFRHGIQGSTMFHFHGLIDFIGSHPQYAVVAVLLLALSEAMPVIGTVVPGSTLILAISALATTADVGAWLLLVAAVIGAIVGDGLAFWLGYCYRRELLRGWPLNRFPRLLARSAQFIRRHGVTAVFLARFTAVVRAFVPLVAGILRMSSRHFYVANVVSALLWAPLHVFPGVLAGIAMSVAGPNGTRLGLLALLVLVMASTVWHLLKRARTQSQAPLAERDMAPLDSQSRTRSR
jgi:membrane protein DedA with SNARE-associated domain